MSKENRELILQTARENRQWGYQAIEDRLKLLNIKASHQTMDVMWATDFFTYEVLTPVGLVTYHVLFFIHHATRKVVIGGIRNQPNGAWVEQIARNLTGWDGDLEGAKYLIHDRDPNYTKMFDSIINGVGIEALKLPPRSPNLRTLAGINCAIDENHLAAGRGATDEDNELSEEGATTSSGKRGSS